MSSSSPPPPAEECQQDVSSIPVAVAHYGATATGTDPPASAMDTTTASPSDSVAGGELTAAVPVVPTSAASPPSVVPDLMRVYESMTQSKTPQLPMPLAWQTSMPMVPPPYPLPSSAPPATPHRKRPAAVAGSTKPKAKSRRKQNKNGKADNDGRWTKRFTWPDALHQDFVAAIFDIGLQQASPSTVLEQMQQSSGNNNEHLTTERIKSHLQKYRLHRQKSKQEFLTAYAAAATQYQAEGGLRGMTSLSGGNVAAHLAVTTTSATDDDDDGEVPRRQQPAAIRSTAEVVADVFTIPRLTNAEKASPIGHSLGYLLGLFHSLKQQLDLQRSQLPRQLVTGASVAPAAAVPDEEPNVVDPRTVAAVSGNSASAASNSNRSSLETSSRMKREMESQMAFQNKMRALKQHELEKLADMTGTTEPAAAAATKAAEDEDFWNAEALDGDLFQFLMDP